MIIDFNTNSEELLDAVKAQYGGRKLNCCLLVNVPTGLPAIGSFYRDVENFRNENIGVDNKFIPINYNVYDFRGNLLKAVK